QRRCRRRRVHLVPHLGRRPWRKRPVPVQAKRMRVGQCRLLEWRIGQWCRASRIGMTSVPPPLAIGEAERITRTRRHLWRETPPRWPGLLRQWLDLSPRLHEVEDSPPKVAAEAEITAAPAGKGLERRQGNGGVSRFRYRTRKTPPFCLPAGSSQDPC